MRGLTAWLLLTLDCIHGFYVPGVAPIDFEKEEKIEIKAVKMTSSKTQLPYEYYSLPMCKPETVCRHIKVIQCSIFIFQVIYQTENLGEVLRGDRIVNSLYDIHVDKSEVCSVLCEQAITDESVKAFQEKILNQYSVHLLADNLPVATKWELEGKQNL